jgi:uncharacterized C2H2 Zn-finger protein
MQENVRCPECGKEFPTQQALEEHVNREHMGTVTTGGEKGEGIEGTGPGTGQEQCPACSGEFPSAESLEKHQGEQHPAERAVS